MNTETFELAVKYFRAPQQFPELSDVGRPLPAGIGDFLNGAMNEADGLADVLPDLWKQASPQERREATLYFVKHVLLASGGDYYRCLGLGRDASGDEIRKNFHALIHLLSVGPAAEMSHWDENSAIRINEAYSVLRQPDKRRAYDADLLPLAAAAPAMPAAPAPETTVSRPTGRGTGDSSFMAKHLLKRNAGSSRSEAPAADRSAAQNPSSAPPPSPRPSDPASTTTGAKPFQQFLDSHFDRAEPALAEEELRRLEYLQLGRRDYEPATGNGDAPEGEVILPDLKDRSALIISETASAHTSRVGPLVIVVVSLSVLLGIVVYAKYTVAPRLPEPAMDSAPAPETARSGFDAVTGIASPREEEQQRDAPAPSESGADDISGSKGDATGAPGSDASAGASSEGNGAASHPAAEPNVDIPPRETEQRASATPPREARPPAPSRSEQASPRAAAPALEEAQTSGAARPAPPVASSMEREIPASAAVTPGKGVPDTAVSGLAPADSGANVLVEAPPAENAITQTEIDRLVATFISAYRAGDIEAFLNLFARDVRTNGRNDIAGIRGDYERFFAETAIREFSLKDMRWNISAGTASGKGRFAVEIRYQGDVESKTVSGAIDLVAESRPEGVLFTQMFHSYD